MKIQRDFLLLVTLIVAATPAFGQTNDSAQGKAATPDLSGIWVHPFWPGFDPPLSGPGPVVNRSRLPSGVGNSDQLVGEYTNPLLKRQAAEVGRKHGEISKAGVTYPTPANQCWPQPPPYIFWTIGVQFLQEPDRVTLFYSNPDHEFRQVRLNGSQPAQVTPSWYGDSVGHYEGDVLVVDTVGIKRGPFAMVDMYGTPHSPALHVVERYRLIDLEEAKGALERNEKENSRGVYSEVDPDYRGKLLQLHFTVEDEGVFTMPWTATITYRRALGGWTDPLCAENR